MLFICTQYRYFSPTLAFYMQCHFTYLVSCKKRLTCVIFEESPRSSSALPEVLLQFLVFYLVQFLAVSPWIRPFFLVHSRGPIFIDDYCNKSSLQQWMEEKNHSLTMLATVKCFELTIILFFTQLDGIVSPFYSKHVRMQYACSLSYFVNFKSSMTKC